MFEGSKLTVKQIFELSYYWCRGNWQLPEVAFQTRTFHDYKLVEHTWVEWGQFFRDVCAEFFVENPLRIGGPGVVVEIDETFLSRQKYHRGQIRGNQGQRMFGGVVKGDASQCFLVHVDRRNAATFLHIIQKQGCRKHMLVEYISEFMWRQKHKGPDVFYHFWEMVSRIYPVDVQTPPASDSNETGEDEAQNNENKVEDPVEGARVSLNRVYIDEW